MFVENLLRARNVKLAITKENVSTAKDTIVVGHVMEVNFVNMIKGEAVARYVMVVKFVSIINFEVPAKLAAATHFVNIIRNAVVVKSVILSVPIMSTI